MENLTPIVYQDGNNHKVIFQCTITGLDSNETDVEIKFDHQRKCTCKHNQQEANIQMELEDAYTTNVTVGELHIPSANASHSGDYHCTVKIHTQQRNECMLVKTLAKTVDIQDTAPPNDNNTIAIATTVPVSVIIIVLLASIILYGYKKKTKQQHNQPEPPQPPGEEQEPEEHTHLIQSKNKTHRYIYERIHKSMYVN